VNGVFQISIQSGNELVSNGKMEKGGGEGKLEVTITKMKTAVMIGGNSLTSSGYARCCHCKMVAMYLKYIILDLNLAHEPQ